MCETRRQFSPKSQKSRKREKRGSILESFWVIFQSKKESQKPVSFKIDFLIIWGDFGIHFGDILMSFSRDFLHWRKVRFWWPFHAKSMIWDAEMTWKIIKNRIDFRLEFLNRLLKRNWSKICRILIKKSSKSIKKMSRKINAFLDDAGSLRGRCRRQWLRQWGVGGNQFYSILFNSNRNSNKV